MAIDTNGSRAGDPLAKPDRSITALLADLADETVLLLRRELTLLKCELREALGRIAQGTTLLAIGGLLAFSGWLVMLAAAILGLSTVVPAWLAALIVGAAVLVSAGVLLYLGKTRFDGQSLVPRRTLRTLRDDEAWLRGWMR
jgi:hypothetical protein